MHILNLFAKEGFKEFSFGQKYTGQEKEISSLFGAKNIGFHLEVMDPRTFSCPYHYHEQEEELMVVIEGEAVVRRNGEFRKVKPGDLVFYETGPQSAHQIYNHTDKPFRYFVLSSKSIDETCHYPDSQKKLERKGQTRSLTQNGVAADYFKDEEDPAIYWPEYALLGQVPDGI